jgi:hypothetical protein
MNKNETQSIDNFATRKWVVLDLDKTITHTHGNYAKDNIRELDLLRAMYQKAIREGHKVCIFSNQSGTEKIEKVIGYITDNIHNYKNIQIVDSKNGSEMCQHYVRILTGSKEDYEEFEELDMQMPQYTTSLEIDDKSEIFPDFDSDDPIKQEEREQILIINPINQSIGYKSNLEPHGIYGKASILKFISSHLGIKTGNILFVDDNIESVNAVVANNITGYDVSNTEDFREAIQDILETELTENIQSPKLNQEIDQSVHDFEKLNVSKNVAHMGNKTSSEESIIATDQLSMDEDSNFEGIFAEENDKNKEKAYSRNNEAGFERN